MKNGSLEPAQIGVKVKNKLEQNSKRYYTNP